jgi:hypothetical protein
LTALPSDDDLFLCCEAAHYPLQKVAAELADRLAHAELAGRLMTRTDVNWKSLAAVGSV